MPTLTMPVRLPDEVLDELCAYTGLTRLDWELETSICEAIRAYMNPAPAAGRQPAIASEAGYQWKQVFLPEGTRLRASFGRERYWATVEGTEIKYDGHGISPSSFANLHGSGNRNAWKAVWLRFPGSEQWVLAETCRVMQQAAIAKQFGVDQVPQAARAAVSPPSQTALCARRAPAEGAHRQRRPAKRAAGKP